jgi:aspartate racemase
MKKIGLIGGLGPESTVDYYREIIKTFNSMGNELVYPEILVYSVNFSEFLSMMREKDNARIISYFLKKINSLAASGADFAALTANTPHVFFNELQDKADIPLVSIVETACAETVAKGLKRPGLFGTGFTMNTPFYQEVFSRHGISIVLPEKNDRELIDHKLFSEIELGIIMDETRDLFIDIIKKMVKKERIDSLILGCTELPLILKDAVYAGIPMLDTTRIHVKEIVNYCLSNEEMPISGA